MIDIVAILQSKERVNIEVKAAGGGIPNSIWETYSSFANTFGGTIILGIEENKDTKEFMPRGVNNPQQMLLDIWNTLNNRQKISNNILLEHHVYTIEYDGMNFVVIEVPRAERREKPIYVGQDMFKGTFRRNHEGDYHCSMEEVKSMLRDQADTTQDVVIRKNHFIRHYRRVIDIVSTIRTDRGNLLKSNSLIHQFLTGPSCYIRDQRPQDEITVRFWRLCQRDRLVSLTT